MKTAYFFGEYLRWDFGLENPNIAGAFIAMLIGFALPFASTLPRKRLWQIGIFSILLILELALWFCLTKTYSRGALVAAIACLAICTIVLALCGHFRRRDFSVLVPKIAAIAVIVIAVGFSKRIEPEFLQNDGSTFARITLWQGGLKMIASSPIEGWGVGNSGKEYINWYQSLDDDRRYAGMVNSYLHIGVERGIPILFTGILALLFLLLLGLPDQATERKLGAPSRLAMGGALAIFAFAVSNVFSTLWIYPSLQWLLALAVLIVTALKFPLSKLKFRTQTKVFGAALIVACVICLAIYIAGKLLANGHSIQKTGDVLAFQGSSELSHSPTTLLMIDEVSLGDYYGKEIRQALQTVPLNFYLVEPEAKIPDDALPSIDTIVIFGDRIKNFNQLAHRKNRIILLNPVGSPPQHQSLPVITKIYLSQFDVYNQHSRWLNFAKKENIAVTFLEATDQRISENALKKALSDIKSNYIDR